MREPDLILGRRSLVILGAVIIASIALSLVAYGALRVFEKGAMNDRALPAPHRVSELRQEEFAALPDRPRSQAAQRKTLDQYGWVDREHGIVRVPIERAIDLVVAGMKP